MTRLDLAGNLTKTKTATHKHTYMLHTNIPATHKHAYRYIERPLLLDGYKFDLRLYVCVTSMKPLEAFLYREGFTRLSSEPYRFPCLHACTACCKLDGLLAMLPARLHVSTSPRPLLLSLPCSYLSRVCNGVS